MSRSNYSEDIDDQWQWIMWRGAVKSAIKGKRGQAFLREMLAALDALPEKKLITDKLEEAGAVCAIGAVGRARGINMTGVDPEDSATVSSLFGISDALARETVYMNDEGCWGVTDELRYTRMRAWVEAHINAGKPDEPKGAT